MADMHYFVNDLTVENDKPTYYGIARCSPNSEAIGWSVQAEWNDTPAQVNTKCEAAAVAAAAAASPSYTVGALDNKVGAALANDLL